MAKKITVVISQGQSQNPAKRKLEEDLVGALLMEAGVEVTLVPNLYDLAPDGTGMLCLEGISGDMVVVSWHFPRAAHWTLDRHGIRGRVGTTLLVSDDEDNEEDDEENVEEDSQDEADDKDRVIEQREVPARTIYCLDFRACDTAEPLVEEIRRIAAETATETVDLMSWIDGSPKPEQLDRYLNPNGGNGNGHTEKTPVATPAQPNIIDEKAERRWYPVIDFSRCTNCMECIDFCLFGVYGVDTSEVILVEQPDNCRKGCPACSRVCPENAILFPQHKTPAIAGSEEVAGPLKIDLSQLFGAPGKDAVEAAVSERDEQLMLAGREAVGESVGIAKRRTGAVDQPKDELDDLMDELDAIDL